MRKLLGIAALLCLTTLQSQAADDKKDDKKPAEEKKTDKDKLKGAWVLSSINAMGNSIDLPEGMQPTFTFDGDKVTIKADTETQEGSYKLDETKKAKEIDLTTPKKDNPKEKETLKALYVLDGDMFKIYISPKGPGGDRPTAIDGKDVVTLTLKRKK